MRFGNTFFVDSKMTVTNGGDAGCLATGLPSQSIPQLLPTRLLIGQIGIELSAVFVGWIPVNGMQVLQRFSAQVLAGVLDD